MAEPGKAKTGEPIDDDFWRRAEEKADAGLDPSRLRHWPGVRGAPPTHERRASNVVHAAFGK